MDHSDIYYERQPNGLTVLLRETHLAPVANLQIWARVGSADELPGEEGLAHFHEHMLFKGTERRGVGEVAGDVEGAGGRINAYTSFDVTVYYATLPIAALDEGLDVLVDAVRHSKFEPAEIAREQEVVLEEIRRSQDTPGHVLSDLTFHEAFTTHPYRAPILGTEASVSGLDRDKVLQFYRRWYAPDNLTVVAAGDFDAKALAARIGDLFADAVPGHAARKRPDEPRHRALRTSVLRRSFEGQRVDLSWPSASFRDDDATHLDLLSFLLGECESSRLVRRLRETEQLVDRIDSSSYTPFDRGLFSINLETDEARSRRAVQAVIEEIERLRSEPVSLAELERARANFLASEHFERESVSGMASKLGGFQVIGGDWRSEDRYFELLRGATREDLQRVAREYLSTEQLTAVALIPDKETDTLDSAALESAIHAGTEAAKQQPRTAVAEADPGRATPRARLAPAPGGNGHSHSLHTYSLPGGATLHVAPRHAVPVVAARAAFSGGLLAETEETAGLGCFLASMWSRGTKSHDAEQFARAIEDLAGDVSGFSGRSSIGLTLESTSDNLLPCLDLFSEVLIAPRFAEDELLREQRETLAAIDRREDQLAQRAFQLFSETEFLEHPYRLSLLGERPSVEGFDVETVRRHHERLVCAPNMTVAIAGDVDPDEVADALTTRLAEMPSGPFTPLAPPPEPLADDIRVAYGRKERAQAHMVLGFRGITVDDPDRYALELISQLLAGQGGRLFLELRDRRSLAYSVSAMNVEGVAPGFFAIYIATSPEKVDEAKDGILEQLRLLVETPPGHDELLHTKQHLIGNHVIDQQRSAARAAHIALDSLYGLGPEAHKAYPAAIEAVSGEDLLRVARRIIRLDAYSMAIIQP